MNLNEKSKEVLANGRRLTMNQSYMRAEINELKHQINLRFHAALAMQYSILWEHTSISVPTLLDNVILREKTILKSFKSQDCVIQDTDFVLPRSKFKKIASNAATGISVYEAKVPENTPTYTCKYLYVIEVEMLNPKLFIKRNSMDKHILNVTREAAPNKFINAVHEDMMELYGELYIDSLMRMYDIIADRYADKAQVTINKDRPVIGQYTKIRQIVKLINETQTVRTEYKCHYIKQCDAGFDEIVSIVNWVGENYMCGKSSKDEYPDIVHLDYNQVASKVLLDPLYPVQWDKDYPASMTSIKVSDDHTVAEIRLNWKEILNQMVPLYDGLTPDDSYDSERMRLAYRDIYAHVKHQLLHEIAHYCIHTGNMVCKQYTKLDELYEDYSKEELDEIFSNYQDILPEHEETVVNGMNENLINDWASDTFINSSNRMGSESLKLSWQVFVSDVKYSIFYHLVTGDPIVFINSLADVTDDDLQEGINSLTEEEIEALKEDSDEK